MTIEWKPSLAIGVDIIDQQHRELFEQVNQLVEACRQGQGQEKISSIIAFLQNYVVEHFKTEEHHMTGTNYPRYLEHRRQHEEFKREFAELTRGFDRNAPDLATVVALSRQVTTWLVNHISKSDKAFGAFLAAGKPT